MSTTRLQEVLICFGKQKQTDIATANTGAGMWRFGKLNAELANPKLNTENDAEEYGKGHEFPTQSFQTSWDVSGTLEKYLGAEIAAWAMAFGLGKVVKSGATPNFTYTCTPLMPANGDAAELPYFSFVEQIRPGAGVVLDRMAVGCVVEGWTIAIGSGPGRANSKITIEFAGSGKVVEPSSIVMPAATAEKLLPSASLALSIDSVDYVSNKNIVSLETGWKNNVRMDAGFYPGSSFQTAGDATSGAIRGRLEFGNRQGTLRFTARFENGSTELTKLKNQTTGTAVISLTYDANNSLEITWQKVSFATAEVGETDGIVTVAVECLPMFDAANGIVSAVAKCGVDNICQQEHFMFDATKPIAMNLRTPEGVKTVRLRFPSDEEWTERQRRRKVIIKQLGRGVSETVVPNSEDVDAALLAKIRTEEQDAGEVDPFEASRIIEQLSQAEVDDVVQDGDAFRIALRVLGGVVAHVLAMPSAKDVFEYRRAFARILDLPFNKQELTINLAAAGALYKKLVRSAEGYAGEVPIIHQAVAVKAAIDALDAAFQEDRDPNF